MDPPVAGEVLIVHRKLTPGAAEPFAVHVVSQAGHKVRARGGLVVEAHFDFVGHPRLDVLVVPGGVVTAELDKPEVIDWVRVQARGAQLTASVCTGAFLLGKAGLLAGKRITTHWEDLDDLRQLLPDANVIDGPRWIDEGNLITSAGISAGIDMSLHLVSRLLSPELATRTARQMQYDWKETP